MRIAGCQRIEASLQERGVPLQALHLREAPSQMQHPLPLRGDLREPVFAPLTMDRPLPGEQSVLLQAGEAMYQGTL